MNLSDEASGIATEVTVHTVLVIDHDRATVSQLRTLLGSAGYEVLVATDGGQAHSLVERRAPDFVILDVDLPGSETGFEVCERLKQSRRQIPVLVLTRVDLPRARTLATRVGADGYLLKPAEMGRLPEVIPALAQQLRRRQIAEEQPGENAPPVRFHCRCGKRFKVAHQHRGKTLTCPSCGEPVLVPRSS
ncbi:MAG: response regulator transcription factor [Planctomycetaceae bacterium]